MVLAASSNTPDTWTFVRIVFDGLTIMAVPLALMAAFLGALFAAKLAYAVFRRIRLTRSGMLDIDRMDGRVFEEYLDVMFARLGYRVVRPRFSGDFGGDLVLSKNGVRTVVQAKRWTKNVGVRAVQEAVAAKGQYDCSEAMVVSNSYYTKQAVQLARKNHVALWDRNELASKLLRSKAKESLERDEIEEEAPRLAPAALAIERPAGEISGSVKSEDVCANCGKSVSVAVRDYCTSHATRFGGRLLCFEHQRGNTQP